MKHIILFQRSKKGFTLIELMIVLLIIAMLAALIASKVADSRCKAGIDLAKTSINSCKSVISLWNSTNSTDVLNCLSSAQTAIDTLAASDWWKAGRPAVLIAANEVNRLVDEMITRASAADVILLTAGKLTVPP